MMSEIRVREAGRVEAELRVPGDKSMSHRAALLAAVSGGSCEIGNFLPSGDCLHTVEAVKALGVGCEVLDELPGAGARRLRLTGPGELRPAAGPIDCGNSGTGMRLLAGLLAGQPFASELGGDESLSSRPMGRVITPLEEMGARVESLGAKPGCAPLRVHGGGLRGIRYRLPVASAQVKSAVMLAGLFADGRTAVMQPAVTRDHTERMLEAFGVAVSVDDEGWISAEPGELPRPRDFEVPGDISSAAFWLVVGAVRPGNRVVVRDLGLNPTRSAVLGVLERMGAGVRVETAGGAGGEPVGTVEVCGAELGDCEVLAGEVPNLIDELPVLAVAGALSKGRFVVRNARELRVKETDRIATMATNLRAFGAEVEEFDDGFEVRGGRPLRAATVGSFGDHRVAMASAVAGMFAAGESRVTEAGCIATSYPGFGGQLTRMMDGGGSLEELDRALGEKGEDLA